LLNAIDLPELITSTQQEYVERAIGLATGPEKLAAIKTQVVAKPADKTAVQHAIVHALSRTIIRSYV
jgi:predicted O-linked N-acetylglucosamine transferase (SPINDLY family)